MSEHTIEITVDGEEREVTLTRLKGFEFLEAAATAPDEMEDGELDPDTVAWLRVLAERVTDLSKKELNQVAPEDMGPLIEACAKVFAGDSPTTSTDDFRFQQSEDPFEGFDLDDDGSVDPDDWR